MVVHAVASSIRRVPATVPLDGMTLAAMAGVHLAPHERERRARVEAAGQHGRQLGDHLGEREGEVLGEVRPRGVAAAAR